MNVIGYAYDGDIYCDSCLDRDGVDYSNAVALFDNNETDYPIHCGECREFLGGGLTSHGVKWLKEQWLVYRWRNWALIQVYMDHYDGINWYFIATPWGWSDPLGNIED